jgi:hypothetical protein
MSSDEREGDDEYSATICSSHILHTKIFFSIKIRNFIYQYLRGKTSENGISNPALGLSSVFDLLLLCLLQGTVIRPNYKYG